MGVTRLIRDRFSNYVEIYKIENHFEYYSDTIEDIIENSNELNEIYLYDRPILVDYNNIKKLLNDELKQKLLIEYSKRNLIKNKHKVDSCYDIF